MKSTTTQNELILAHLQTGAPITGIEALNNWGCFRLASRISDLRREGHDIMSQMVERNGRRYAKYFLYRPTGELK